MRLHHDLVAEESLDLPCSMAPLWAQFFCGLFPYFIFDIGTMRVFVASHRTEVPEIRSV